MTSSSSESSGFAEYLLDPEAMFVCSADWQSMSLGSGEFEQELHQFRCAFEGDDAAGRNVTLDANGIADIDNLNVPEIVPDFVTEEDLEIAVNAVSGFEGENCEPKEMDWSDFEQPQPSAYPSASAKGNSTSSSCRNGSVRPTETVTSLKLPSLPVVQAYPNEVGLVVYQSLANYENQSATATASANGTINQGPALTLSTATAPATRSRTTHLRKSAIEERVIAVPPSPPLFVDESAKSIKRLQQDLKPDIKPDIVALGINNGQRRSRRINNIGDSGDLNESSHGHFTRSKKIRKYEMTDIDDPTVKNAKAAKMNRERKKQEVIDLKNTVSKLTSDSVRLAEEARREHDARLLAEEALAREREKKQLSSSLNSQCSTLKDVLEGVVEGLQRKFEKTFKVEVDNRFAEIPASVLESGEIIAGSPGETASNAAGESSAGAKRGNNKLFVNNVIPFEVNPEIGVLRIMKPDPTPNAD